MLSFTVLLQSNEDPARLYCYSQRKWHARADTARERVVTPFSLACMADSYCGLWAEVMGQ